MTWNYRIVKTYHEESKEYVYAIHEAYYDEQGKVNFITQDPISIIGESTGCLKWMLDSISEALTKPILEDKDFNKEKD
jgi:hypothetical protein